MTTGEWILLGIWALSVAALSGQAWAQSRAQGAVQDISRESVKDLNRTVSRLIERQARSEALLDQCPCLDGKYIRKCPEIK